MKPKDVGRCPKLGWSFLDYEGKHQVFFCESTRHQDYGASARCVYDTPCTLADYKDCEYREEK
jgi:hypothetical protein